MRIPQEFPHRTLGVFRVPSAHGRTRPLFRPEVSLPALLPQLLPLQMVGWFLCPWRLVRRWNGSPATRGDSAGAGPDVQVRPTDRGLVRGARGAGRADSGCACRGCFAGRRHAVEEPACASGSLAKWAVECKMTARAGVGLQTVRVHVPALPLQHPGPRREALGRSFCSPLMRASW